MSDPGVDRRRWRRVVLTLSPEIMDALYELARANYRDPKREALRLLVEGIERESQGVRNGK